MLKLKAVAAAATTLGLITMIAAGPATAATNGVGTGQASTTVLGVRLGGSTNLLSLSAIVDAGRSTIDKQVAANPEAYSNLTAFSVGSSVVSALNNAVPAPPLEARQPSGQASVNGSAVNLGTTLTHPEIVNGNVVPAVLKADLTNGAHSTVDVGLTDLAVAGGLVSAKSIQSTLGTAAAADAASATRSVNIGAVSVLDLGALLNGLGIPLASLPVQSISDLVDTLHATVPGGLVPSGSTVADVQAALDGAISDVNTAIAGSATTVDTTLAGTLGGVLTPLGVTPPSSGDSLATVLATLQSTLDNLLTGSLTALANLSLLSLDGANVTINTKAMQKASDSVADITASVGNISVGGIVVPGVNLLTAASTISSTMKTVNDTISSALGGIDPGLANLVTISLFDPITKTVSTDNGYTRARAGLTVLTANVTPPAALSAIVSGITGQASSSIGAAITGAGGTVPAVAAAMTTLTTTLNQGASALSEGAAVTVGSILSASDYAVPVSGGGGPTMATTGANPALALIGLLFALMALGLRRYLSSPAVRD